MRVLALDLSTSTGVALFDKNQLLEYTLIKRKVKGNPSSEDYPFNYLEMADEIATKVFAIATQMDVDYIVIEETNKGRNRYFQKQLEYIHYAVASWLRKLSIRTGVKVRYIDTSAWRSILGISLDSDQRKNNKSVRTQRDAKKQEILQDLTESNMFLLENDLKDIVKKRERNKIIKMFEKEMDQQARTRMRGFRTKESKIDTKNLAVNYVNDNFNLGFKKKDNDMADAICVGWAFILNNYQSTLRP